MAALILYVGLRALTKHAAIPQLKRPALLLIWLLVVQLLLGFAAYVTRIVQGASEVQPTGALVVTTVAHLGVGALILAATLVLIIQAHRHSRQRAEVVLFESRREVATV